MNTSQQQTVVNIEAFDENLFGKIILYQKHTHPEDYHRLPPIREKCNDLRVPYKRRLLISNIHNKHINNVFFDYDTIFYIQEMSDWSLVLTYIAHSPKPLFILIENVAIPNIVWTKLIGLKQGANGNSQEGFNSRGVGGQEGFNSRGVGGGAGLPSAGLPMTIVHFMNTPVASIQPYTCVFYQPIMTATPASILDNIYTQILTTKHSYNMREFRETIAELRIADAGLCVLNGIELYWYDPVDNDIKIGSGKMAEILRWLSAHC
jgi:hypothetical protein